MLTRTIDEYVASLYDHLQDSLAITRDCAIKEAQRQKRLYDRKVGAVELRPGDQGPRTGSSRTSGVMTYIW